ncbi:type II toxin-antitoxin system mRNA interferase toxin, RelE/StbE family [Candidatus Roizmanbacteria bacterium CG_4_9_14_3_um_filter_33_18]|uniref:Type II toxin-antitoxin system mRNA interferase toxin, RelE/StbE family n=4 Tax=Candidatus Roizmaniibacteriota TaxID=1752723 RepID=A0A2M7AUU5_9BACT|nr:MAG: type II toxin-antitoxin system mRNA interferase toxin, RelE/StbE family [Candidatus Roizmanbacteria bacterium CG22_combo_CG10-13_8_21_14_all_34_12]PIU36598.1 MAG: type II toxin-antitoxin system mRNA interferase toxin, RelE/StbE family [Candidatus Roizmanbacteria bacterium CG07_land_8_20_14_0_80_34_15]PIU74410.1 MAG: type II toxin-antitoxin system mRNA interferase toxin, RelE/StbE family [Candidatus Roizmanbacteria bacterium CG06_land_8_20_14_3_00_34_14]PJA55232.1 MAG: type II toxin-antit
MHKIILTKNAKKELTHLVKKEITIVLNKIYLLDSPFPQNLNIKKLTGSKYFFRLRVGKIRVIFELDNNKKEIWIRKIGYRKDIYRSF